MRSREVVQKTLNFDHPDRVPTQIWLLRWAEVNYPNESARLRSQYPDDLIQCPALYEKPPKLTGSKFTKGTYIDEWGCTFHNPDEGIMGIVPEALIADWSDLTKLKPPEEFLHPDRQAVNAFCKSTDQFVYQGSIIRPFERFQFIRTMEQSFMDVLFEEAGYHDLLKILHEHYLKEVEAWCRTDIDAIYLMDDWGTQHALMVNKEVFTRHFKPMYRDYCELARNYGKFVFMHSDGNITDIIEDLIEVGVNALNSQVFCMNINELSERFAGRITFWGEVDRQHLLPNGTEKEIVEAVQLLYDKFWRGGGLIGQSEFGPAANPANLETVFRTFSGIRV